MKRGRRCWIEVSFTDNANNSEGPLASAAYPASGTVVAVSTDATLSALTVSPKDIIGFAADRTSYEVGVASTVTQATITATKSHSAATVAYSTTDADTSAGHQVNLSDGRNEVTITVTAEDTTTTGTYTVSINRGVTAIFGWKASDDFDGLITAENNHPADMWSDGTTMWVSDLRGRQALRLRPGHQGARRQQGLRYPGRSGQRQPQGHLVRRHNHVGCRLCR